MEHRHWLPLPQVLLQVLLQVLRRMLLQQMLRWVLRQVLLLQQVSLPLLSLPLQLSPLLLSPLLLLLSPLSLSPLVSLQLLAGSLQWQAQVTPEGSSRNLGGHTSASGHRQSHTLPGSTLPFHALTWPCTGPRQLSTCTSANLEGMVREHSGHVT